MSRRTRRQARRLYNRAIVAVGCEKLAPDSPCQVVSGLCIPCQQTAWLIRGCVQAKVATLALDDESVLTDTHGVAYSRQTIRQSSHLFVGENEGLGSTLPNGAEFHQGLISACRVVTDRHVLGLVFVNENKRRSRTRLGSKAGLGGQYVRMSGVEGSCSTSPSWS